MQRVVPAAVAACHVDPLRFLRADLPSLPPPLLRATLRLLLAFFPPPSQRTLTFPGPGTGGSHSTLPLPAPAEAPPAGDESLCTFPLHSHLLPLLLLRLSPPPADLAPDVDWLCTAAMLSSHAFHARQSEAVIWLRFLPTMAPGSAGSSAAAARGVAAFLADAVACVARAPLKYLLALPAASPPPAHASHCPSCRARGHTPMGSLGPFPACILTNCIKVLHATSPSPASSSSSSSSSSSLPVQLAIATFTCNALTHLISLQRPLKPCLATCMLLLHPHTHSLLCPFLHPPVSVPAPSCVRACTLLCPCLHPFCPPCPARLFSSRCRGYQQECPLPLAALITHILRPALSSSSSTTTSPSASSSPTPHGRPPLSASLLCLQALLESAASLLPAQAEGQPAGRGKRPHSAAGAGAHSCDACDAGKRAAVEAAVGAAEAEQASGRDAALSHFTLALSSAHPPSLISLLPRLASLAASLPPPAMPLLSSTLCAHALLPSLLPVHAPVLLEASVLAQQALLPAATCHHHHMSPAVASPLPLLLPPMPSSPHPSTIALSHLLLSLPFAPLLSLCVRALLAPLKLHRRLASCLAALLLARLRLPSPPVLQERAAGASHARLGEGSLWGERRGEVGRAVVFELGRVLGVGTAGGEQVGGAEWRRRQRCVRVCMAALEATLMPPPLPSPSHPVHADSAWSDGRDEQGQQGGMEDESAWRSGEGGVGGRAQEQSRVWRQVGGGALGDWHFDFNTSCVTWRGEGDGGGGAEGAGEEAVQEEAAQGVAVPVSVVVALWLSRFIALPCHSSPSPLVQPAPPCASAIQPALAPSCPHVTRVPSSPCLASLAAWAGWMAAVLQGMAHGRMADGSMVIGGGAAGDGERESVRGACEHMALTVACVTFQHAKAAVGEGRGGLPWVAPQPLPQALQHSTSRGGANVCAHGALTALVEAALHALLTRATRQAEHTAIAALEAAVHLPCLHIWPSPVACHAPCSHVARVCPAALERRVIHSCVHHPSWRRGNLLSLLLAAHARPEERTGSSRVAGEVVQAVAEWMGGEERQWSGARSAKGVRGRADAGGGVGHAWWQDGDGWIRMLMLLPAVAVAVGEEGEGGGAAGTSMVACTYRDMLLALLSPCTPPYTAAITPPCHLPLSHLPPHILPSLLSYVPALLHSLLLAHPLPRLRLASLVHVVVPHEQQEGGMQGGGKGARGKGRGSGNGRGEVEDSRGGVIGGGGWRVQGGCVTADSLLQVALASRLACTGPVPTAPCSTGSAAGAGSAGAGSCSGERESTRRVWGTPAAQMRVLAALLNLLGSIFPLAPEAQVAVVTGSGGGSGCGQRKRVGGEGERAVGGGRVTMAARELQQVAAVHVARVATHLARALTAAPPAPVSPHPPPSPTAPLVPLPLLQHGLASLRLAAVACLKHRFAHPLAFHSLTLACRALLAAATAPSVHPPKHPVPAAPPPSQSPSQAAAAAVSSVGCALLDLLLAHSRTLPLLLSPSAGPSAAPLPAALAHQLHKDSSRAVSLPSPLSLIPSPLLPDLPLIAASCPPSSARSPPGAAWQVQEGQRDADREELGEEAEMGAGVEVKVRASELLHSCLHSPMLWPLALPCEAPNHATREGREGGEGERADGEAGKRRKRTRGKGGSEGDEEGECAGEGAARLELLRLMTVFLRMRLCHVSGRVCSSACRRAMQSLFALLLALYGATLSPTDRALLALMHLLTRLARRDMPRAAAHIEGGEQQAAQAARDADGVSAVGAEEFLGFEWFDYLWGQGAASRWEWQQGRGRAPAQAGGEGQAERAAQDGREMGVARGKEVGGNGDGVFEGREQRQWRFWWEEAAVDATRCGLLVLAFPALRHAHLGGDAGEQGRDGEGGGVEDVEQESEGVSEWMGHGGTRMCMCSASCRGGQGDPCVRQQAGKGHPLRGSAAAQDVAVQQAAYDPAFLLPFTLHALSRRLLSPRMAARSGLVAAAIASLASAQHSMRRLGYATLALFAALLEEQEEGWREQHAVQHVVRCVRATVTTTWQRLPRLSVLFMAEMLQVMHLGGASPLFPLLSQSLLSQPSFNPTTVPLLLPCLMSGSPHHRAQRTWLLHLLAALALPPFHASSAASAPLILPLAPQPAAGGEGQEMGGGRGDGDKVGNGDGGSGNADEGHEAGSFEGDAVLRRRFVVELLGSFFACGVSDVFTCKLILQVLRRVCCLPSYAGHLVRQGGLLLWLTAVVLSASHSLHRAHAHTAHLALLLPTTPRALQLAGSPAATAGAPAAGRAEGRQSEVDVLALAVEVLHGLLSCPCMHAALLSHATSTSHHLLLLTCALERALHTVSHSTQPLSPSSLGLARLTHAALVQLIAVLPEFRKHLGK
ncbi:unnamed protein product [Closterium sp. Naga37s-1]|nr:unnamed protein product [Closterium sp. Naga37s-1]